MSGALRIGIVGAGPAGIMAALEAARLGAQVLLFDTNDIVGRKLLVTGNGRCNISNTNVHARRYTCADPHFVEALLASFRHHETITYLHDLGIPTYATSDGWCYPLSNSAASVAAILAAALETAGVVLHLKTKISDVIPTHHGFTLVAGGPDHTYSVDRVIVATGGKAYPALGSKGTFFPVLQRLGHTIAPIYPALVPLNADMRALHKLQGVRLDVRLTLLEQGVPLGSAVGNMMFTQSGLSGPAAMDLSHLVSTRPGHPLTAWVDLLPYSRDVLVEILRRKRSQPWPLTAALNAVLPAKMPPAMIALAGLPQDVRLDELDQKALDKLLYLLAHLEIRVLGTRGFQHAQLSTGGVPVTEVEPYTMASRRVVGLHLAGEVLDVVGPCGGYNLQFALSSGVLAGRGAIR